MEIPTLRGYMRNFIILTILIFTKNIYAACDTPIARTNFSPNTVISSTAMNSQLNTAYTHVNDLDGSCVTDATITSAKLDTSDLGPVVKAPKVGCEVTRTNASTLSIDECIMAVGGNMIETTAATSVTWGCTGCASEATNTVYYLYADSTSDTTTIVPIISTTAPDGDGYSSGDRILGKFYNNGSGDIVSDSVVNWVENRFDFQTVFFSYNSDSGATATTGANWLYEDILEDNYGFYNTTTGVATIPSGFEGKYNITATKRTNSSYANTQFCLEINGVEIINITRTTGTSTPQNSLISGVFDVGAGETIEIVNCASASRDAQSGASQNYFSVKRIQ